MKDLVLGEYDGHIRIYLNTNSDSDPQFNGYTYLTMNGSSYDVGLISSPFIIDWNNDGKKDVICGEDFGRIHLLLNSGTDSDPVFNSAIWIQDGTGDLDVGDRSCPVVADWNRDGKKDLIVGEIIGRLFYYENIGSDAQPSFNGYTLIEAGGGVIDVISYSRPFVVDWDNDNVDDILSGKYSYSGVSGGVYYFHALLDPTPDITIDGQDGPLSIPSSQSLTMSVSLDPGIMHGEIQDFWIVAQLNGSKIYSWRYPGNWTPGLSVTYRGNLIFLDNYMIHYGTLPVGSFKFCFSVDSPNSIFEGTYLDIIEVTVY